MKPTFAFAAALMIPLATLAQEAPAADAPPAFATVEAQDARLEDFLWQNRPIVVFADSPANPAYIEQLQLLEEGWGVLAERDVVVITDTDPGALTAIRQKLRPRGFMMVLMGKDGQIALRKPFPWDAREISRSIDKIPERQEELRRQRTTSP
jgi:hypothetical protein